MFKIEVFVDDKKLAEALRALAGLALGQPSVVPVVNAEHSGGKIKAATNGSLLDMFHQHLTKTKTQSFRAADVKAFLKSVGKSEGSSNYLSQQAAKAGFAKKSGKGSAMSYTVVPKKG
jgi:hypothetical protein